MTDDPKTQEAVWRALGEVMDPEIPVLSLVDLKVVRGVRIEDDCVVVTMTPTFAGCPAMDQMKRDVIDSMQRHGFSHVRIETVLSPSWTTDALTDETKEKLRVFGIAAPPRKRETFEATLMLPVSCPFCGSAETKLESSFGATLCKQIFYCDHCRQSFERFKPI